MPADLYRRSLYLAGQCYLKRGRYEKERYFRLAVNKFGKARQEGLETPDLYRNLGLAYEKFDPIQAAQTYRKLFQEIEPSVCNCLRAAEMYIRATDYTKIARDILEDGYSLFEKKEQKKIDSALRAIGRGRERKKAADVLPVIKKLRETACR